MLRTFLAVIALAAPAIAAAEPERTASLTIEPLPEHTGAWLIVHTRPVSANSLLVETADGTLVLCDTPMTEAATVELIDWARDRFGERRWIVVNGHFHPDCTAGNGAMIDAGAEVWASAHTANLLRERGQAFLDSLAKSNAKDERLAAEFRATRNVAPTHTFDPADGAALPVEGEQINVVFPGHAHAPDNVVTHFADRAIVFAGCMCFSAARDSLGYTGDADLDAWPAALERVAELDATTVVPGHGRPGGPELLPHTADVLRRHAPRPDAAP